MVFAGFRIVILCATRRYPVLPLGISNVHGFAVNVELFHTACIGEKRNVNSYRGVGFGSPFHII